MSVAALPILFAREWRRGWSGGWGYAQRSLYAAALGSLGLLPVVLILGAKPWSAGDLSDFAGEAFAVLCRLQFIAATFLGILAYSRGLARERENGSLDLLLMTPAGGASILAGKVAGQWAGSMAMLAAGIPALVLLLPLGGVGAGQIVTTQLILAGHLATLAGLCGLVSVIIRGQVAAMVAGGIIVGLLQAISWYGNTHTITHTSLWMKLNPSLQMEYEAGDVRPHYWRSLQIFGGGIGFMAAASVAAGLLLRRIESGRRSRGSPEAAPKRKAAGGFRERLIAKAGLADRPLVARELLRSTGRGLLWSALIVLVLELAGAAIAKGPTVRGDYADRQLLAAACVAGLLALLATLRAAAGLAAQRRRGTLEILLASNVEPEEILASRLVSSIVPSLVLLAIPAVHAGIALALQPIDGEWIAAAPVSWWLRGSLVSAFLVCWAAVWSQLIAVHLRRPTSAAAASLVLGIVPSILIGFASVLSWGLFALVLAPGATILMGVHAFTARRLRARAV